MNVCLDVYVLVVRSMQYSGWWTSCRCRCVLFFGFILLSLDLFFEFPYFFLCFGFLASRVVWKKWSVCDERILFLELWSFDFAFVTSILFCFFAAFRADVFSTVFPSLCVPTGDSSCTPLRWHHGGLSCAYNLRVGIVIFCYTDTIFYPWFCFAHFFFLSRRQYIFDTRFLHCKCTKSRRFVTHATSVNVPERCASTGGEGSMEGAESPSSLLPQRGGRQQFSQAQRIPHHRRQAGERMRQHYRQETVAATARCFVCTHALKLL